MRLVGLLLFSTAHDPNTATWLDRCDWQLFAATEMKNWTAHGPIFLLKELSWADEYVWVPDCAQYKRRYCSCCPVKQDYIDVAAGNRPWGPLKNPLDKSLTTQIYPPSKKIQRNAHTTHDFN